MFFPGKENKNCFFIQKMIFLKMIETKIKNKKREVTEHFPARYHPHSYREGIFQFISYQIGSLTLETALVLPLFLFAMLAMLQFASVQYATSRLLAGAQDTVKNMAAYAYIESSGITSGDGVSSDLLKGGISFAYASGQVKKRSGVDGSVGKVSLLQSGFTDGQILDLVGTFQPAHTFTILPVTKVKSIFRTRVRAWTGRTGSLSGDETDGDGEEEQEETVYVAETGQVYHRDPECTHIRLSIRTVPRGQLKGLRNVSGGKYHACERCGAGKGGSVYISPYGDKYHSSLKCSGLKRTVSSVSLSDAGDLRPCSKCGKK